MRADFQTVSLQPSISYGRADRTVPCQHRLREQMSLSGPSISAASVLPSAARADQSISPIYGRASV